MIVGRNWRKRWEFKLMLKCHCANSSEIGTSIINDVGRQAAQKKTTKIHVFWSNLIKQHFILMIWRYILTFNAKMIFQKKITKINNIIHYNLWPCFWHKFWHHAEVFTATDFPYLPRIWDAKYGLRICLRKYGFCGFSKL